MPIPARTGVQSNTNLAAPGKRVRVNLSKRGAEAEKARRARGDEGDADALSFFITSGSEAWALRVPPLPSFKAQGGLGGKMKTAT